MSLIREGRTPRSLAPAEFALSDYAFEIAAGRRIPPRVAEALHAYFNARQIVDIALLAAYFMAASALAIGLEVAMEGAEEFAIERERQSRRLPPV